MANNNGGRINFDVNMNVNKSSLNDIIKPLQQIQTKMNSMSQSKIEPPFRQAAAAAKQLESIINSSWNDKLNQLNLDKFNQSVKTSFSSLSELKNTLSGAGAEGDTAFNSLASSVLNTNLQLRQSNRLLDSMATSMANTVKWGITSSIFNNITGSIQKAYYYAKDLDTSLNDIRIVTGDSADQMQRFARTANDAAKDLGRSTLDYTKAALGFYQQGLSDQEVAARTNVTLKAQNITGGGSQMVDQLTAVWNGFNISTEDTQGIVDKLAKVADSSASNMAELATAMSKVAATANTMGVNVDQLTSQLATVIATTRQAPESVGTAFKAIYSRLNDIKTGADDAEISLGNYSGKMAELGFSVLDANGQLRATGDVIEQIGSHWDQLSKAQQIYLAQTMGGIRQVTQVVALFDNWTKYSDLLNASLSAQGTLNQKNDVYLQSTAAHLEQLGAEAERTYAALFDMDTVNVFVDALGGALSIFNDFIEGIGGGASAFIYFGSVVANIFSKQISDAILKAKDNFDKIQANKAAESLKNEAANLILGQRLSTGDYDTSAQQAATEAAKKQAQIYQQIASVKQNLTQQTYNELTALQKTIGVNTQRIQMIRDYQAQMNAVTNSDNASQKMVLDTIQERQAALDTEKEKYQNVLNSIDDYINKIKETGQSQEFNKQVLEDINDLEKSDALAAEEKQRLQEICLQLNKDQKISDEDIKFIHQMINKQLQLKKKLLNQANDAYKHSKQFAQGQAEKLEEANKAAERLLKNTIDRAKQAQRMQETIRDITTGISSATAALSAIAKYTEQGATGAEKANAAWAGIQGSLPGIAGIIANQIAPGTGRIVSTITAGVIGLGKAFLEVTGIWDKIENNFKSSQEKIKDLKTALSEVGQNDKTKNAQISNLEDLVEEYEKLSSKAGQYGSTIDNLTQEEKERYWEITDQFTQYNDAVIAGYDEQGHAIVRGQQALLDTIEVLKQAKIQADKAALGSKDKVFSGIQAKYKDKNKAQITDVNKEITDLESQILNIDQDLARVMDSADLENSLLEYSFKIRDVIDQADLSDELEEKYNNFILKLDDAINTGNEKLLEEAQSLGKGLNKAYSELSGHDLMIQFPEFDNIFLSESALNKLRNQYAAQLEKLQETKEKLVAEAEKIVNYDQEDANTIIKSFQVFNNDLWEDLEQKYQQSGLNISSLVSKFSDIIMSYGIDTDLDQIDKILIEQANEIEQILSNYGDILKQAEQNAATDLEQKLNEDSTNTEISEIIKQSIYDNWLNNSTIQQMLKDDNSRHFIEDLIKNIYGLEDFSLTRVFGSFDIDTIKTTSDSLMQNITNAILTPLQQKGNLLPEQAQEILNQIDLEGVFKDFTDEQKLAALQVIKGLDWDEILKEGFQTFPQALEQLDFGQIGAITGGGVKSSGLNSLGQMLKDAILSGLDQQAQEEAVQKIQDNIDQITSSITSFKAGKFVSGQEKGQLADILGLSDEQLARLQTNADWLQIIMQKLQLLEQGSVEKMQALQALYPTMKDLQMALASSAISEEQYDTMLPEIMAKQMDSLNLTIDALKEYADMKGVAFDTQKDQALALALYQQDKSFGSLTDAISKSKDQIKEYAQGTSKDLTKSTEAITSVKQAWEQLTGTQVSTDFIVYAIDDIAKAAQESCGDLQRFFELLNQLGEQNPMEQLTQQYESGRTRAEQGASAKQALSSGKSLSGEQSQAIAELMSQDEQFANIAATHDMYSQQYLQALDAAIERQKTLNEVTAQGLLTEAQARTQKLQEQQEAAIQKQQSLQEEFQAVQKITEEKFNTAKAIQEEYAGREDLNNIEQKQLEVANNIVQQHEDNLELQKQIIQAGQEINQKQEEINESKAKELEITSQIHQQSREPLDADVDVKEWEDLSDYIQNFSDQIQGLAPQVKGNAEAADELAQAILRYDAALESVQKNYDDWEKALTSGNVQEAAEAANELQNVYADLLDLPMEGLSDNFLSDIDNLHDLQEAAAGSEQAYDRLRQAAAQDILTQVGLDTDRFYSDQAAIQNSLYALTGQHWDDIEVGAALDDAQFLQALTDMVNAAGMTADQATAYLASMGINAKVTQHDTEATETKQEVGFQPQEMPIAPFTFSSTYLGLDGLPHEAVLKYAAMGYTYQPVPIQQSAVKQNKAFTLEVQSANKSSGGGFKFNNAKHSGGSGGGRKGGGGKGGKGGGGKKPKSGGSGKKASTEKTKDPKVQKALEDKQDRYHDINIEIKHINDELQKLKQNEDKLTGKALIDNLNKQLKVLNKQIDAYQTKIELEKQERDQLKKQLQGKGVKFDVDGDITNYSTILSAKLKEANDIIAQYNAMSAEQQQKHKDMVQQAKKNYQDFKDKIERYDDLVSDEIPGLEKDIRDMRDQMVEKQIQKFKINVELQLDTSQAERDFNAFKKKVIDQISDEDILGNALASLKDLSSYYKQGPDVIDTLTSQINQTLEQLYQIDKTGSSSVYGDNKSQALQDLKKYTDDLMDNLEDIQDLIQEIKDSIFDAIDAAQDAFDTQVDEYEFLSDLLDHNIKMTELLYGDDAYETMAKYYSMQQQNNNKQLDFLRRQKDMWFNRMVEEQERMSGLDAGSKAFQEAEKRFEEYKQHWMDATDDLNDKLEQSLENIIDKYANAIDLTFDKLQKKLTDGKGLDYIEEEWELINKQADLYLDTVNSMYEIEKLENAYQDAIKDNEGNLNAQKSLTGLMKEQLAYLKDKDKLTQYDVDRANALLQIEIKRLALEQQRNNKTKLRLRRDTQGNYTYQYTVDKESVQGAEQELRDAEVSLYNMTKQAYKNNLDSYYDTVSDWQDRIKQVYKDTTLTVEEQQQKVAMLNEHYGNIINGLTEQNQSLKYFMMKDTVDELSKLYDTNVENFKAMSDNEKQVLMKQMIPYWDSGIQHMADKVTEEGGFLPTIQKTFEDVAEATKDYQRSLDELQVAAGVDFAGIEFAISQAYQEALTLTDANQELIRSYDDQITSIGNVIDQVQKLTNTYNTAKEAATAATTAAFEYWQQENKNSIAMAAKQTTASTPSNKKSSSSSGSGNKKSSSSSSSSGSGSKSSGGSGGGSGGSGSSGGGSGSGSSGSSSVLQKAKNATSNYLSAAKKAVYGMLTGASVVASVATGKWFKRYDTGGYTGSWGNEGKLALLDQKELVLNKEDTSNILQAVAVVRSMNDILSGIKSDTSLANTNSSNVYNSSNNSVDQNVKIEAHFPNVKDHLEIEQALNNLVNQASQFAFKN